MLIEKNIKIKVSKKNISHLISKGYIVKLKDIINIKTEDLNTGSHLIIKVKCDICNTEKELSFQKYIKNIKNDNFYACSSKCAQDKVKKTSFKKFGTEYYMQTNEYKERVNISDQEKYGCHHTQNENIKNKIKNTNLKLYGAENVFASEEIKNKIKKTNMNIYGVENPSYSKEIKEKLSITNKEIWSKKAISEFNILSIDGENYKMKCDNNKDHEFIIHRGLLSNRKTIKTIFCTICNPIKSNTGLQSQIRSFIEKLDIKSIYNTRSIISPLELDIYIPDLKIAFEFNGLYWHSEVNKENNYHLNKTELCEHKGIQLIHIWEDDWLYKQEIVKSMILSKLNKTSNIIYADKTEIKEINDNKIIREFLNKNHIKGFVGSKIKIGLFYENELVSLMIFGNKSENKYKLLRFCNKVNTNVTGGARKMFNYFIENYNSTEIITHADRTISQGELYKTLGFAFIKKTEPDYNYIINCVRHNRFNFRKDKLVKEGFDIDKSEHDIMLERKIYRIYNSGNLKFIYKYI